MSAMPAATTSPLDEAQRRLAQAKALIFDIDGTLAETEEMHRAAFNEAFAQAGLDWHWDRRTYRDLLQVAGGKERIRAFDQRRGAGPPISDKAIAELHQIKTERFAALMAAAGCPLRPGARALLEAARARGQKLAIATTTTRINIDALLEATLGARWEGMFAAVVAADDVTRKKPAPDAYMEVLSQLDLPPNACVAFEDSGNGLLAAVRAGVPCIVIRSTYFSDDDFTGALAVVDEFTELGR